MVSCVVAVLFFLFGFSVYIFSWENDTRAQDEQRTAHSTCGFCNKQEVQWWHPSVKMLVLNYFFQFVFKWFMFFVCVCVCVAVRSVRWILKVPDLYFPFKHQHLPESFASVFLFALFHRASSHSKNVSAEQFFAKNLKAFTFRWLCYNNHSNRRYEWNADDFYGSWSVDSLSFLFLFCFLLCIQMSSNWCFHVRGVRI